MSEQTSTTESLRRAFAMVARQHAAWPTADVSALIEIAAERFGLSPIQRSWMQWSFAPDSVALQSKEPSRSR